MIFIQLSIYSLLAMLSFVMLRMAYQLANTPKRGRAK